MTNDQLLDKSVRVASEVVMDDSVQLEPYCIIGMNQAGITKIGAGGVIRSHTVIYGQVTIGQRVHLGHGVLVRELTQIGDDVSIGSHSVVEHHVTIGNKVRVHSNVFIPEYTQIDDEAWIGPGVIFTNARFPAAVDTKQRLAGVKVGKKAKLGAGCVILPGVEIGEGALIGAGAVVTKDVSAGMVYIGQPARMVKEVSELVYEDGSSVY